MVIATLIISRILLERFSPDSRILSSIKSIERRLLKSVRLITASRVRVPA